MSRSAVKIEFCRMIYIRAFERYFLGTHADIEAFLFLQTIFFAVHENDSFRTNINNSQLPSLKKKIYSQLLGHFQFQWPMDRAYSSNDDSIDMAVYHINFILFQEPFH